MKKSQIHNTKKFWACLLLAQFILFFALSKSESVVRFVEGFFEWQKAIHQKLFSVFSFSIGDVFYVLLIFYLIFLLVQPFIKKNKRHGNFIKILIVLNVFYFIYQIFWGLLYFQTPIIEKLSKEEPTLKETKTLALKYLEKCKQNRALVKEDRNGVFKIYDFKAVENEILTQQKQIPKFISTKKGTEIKAFKPSIFKEVMNYSGILGYYNPFTAEAQYNAQLPASFQPFTLAHESAHQLGFAREQEANFIGYLIGRNSKNPDLLYSTNYFVLKSLLNALVEKNPEFVKSVIRNYSPGMKRDRLYEKVFMKRHEGFLDVFFGITNNLFLKSNQQEGSITYSYFVDLLLRYEKN